jgi:homoserine kinase type II
MLRAGALRFWTSRLWDFHLPRDAAMLKAHDPEHFERVLRQRLVPGFALASEGRPGTPNTSNSN